MSGGASVASLFPSNDGFEGDCHVLLSAGLAN